MNDMKRIVLQSGHYARAATLALALAPAAPLLAQNTGAAAAQAQQAYQFDIPSKPLPQAIADLSAVTGLQVLYTEPATFKHTAPALQGRYTTHEALQRLLAGSGLAARFTGRNAVTIELMRQGEVRELSPLTVRAGPRESAYGPVDGYVARQSATATKTDTPLIETPQTINVVSAEQMRAQGANSVDEALRYTPGVATDFYGGATYNDYVRLRGFESVVFSDGMRLPSGLRDYARLRLEPYGLERVEVLKGPASVMYGQAAPGGMINTVRKRPTADPVREVEVSAGSFGRRQGAFDFSGALDEGQTVLYRLTALARDSETQVEAIRNDRYFVAPSLTWQPSANTRFTIFTHYQHDKGGNSPLPAAGTVYPTPFGYLPIDAVLGYPDFNRYERDQYSLGYEFEHRFNDTFKARQKVEYARVKMDYRYSVLTGLQTDPATGALSLARSIQHTRDTATSLAIDNSIQADFDTGPLQHTLLVGLDYSRLDFDSYWGGDYTGGRVDVFHPRHDNRPPDPQLAPDQDGAEYQTGLYAQDQIKWNNWVLAFGGRHDWARSTVHNANNGTTARQEDKVFTGRAGLVYLFDNGIAPYLSYSTSFEPTAGADAAGEAFKPTKAKQFEAGVRYQPPGSPHYLGVSAYQLTQDNVLTQDPNPPANNPWAQIQTGQVRVRGIELEAKANLASGLDVVASYAYQDAEITRTNTASQLGNRFQLTPRHQAALWADYTIASGPLEGLGVGAGIRYIGSRYGDLNNQIELASVTLLDAALSYDFGKRNPSLKHLTLRVNARNLQDKRYVASCASMTSGNCYYGEGRSVVATVGYRW